MSETPRPRHTRTRAGCLTCRLRKKKCDEVKPRCAGCRRNQLACEWPPHTSDRDDDDQVPAQHGQLARRPAPSMRCAGTQRLENVRPAIPVLHSGDERACGLTPQSVVLLGHFVCQTASLFAMGGLEDNPFVAILLPLAYMDDLLMHGLLALSGAHLTYKEPGSTELARATRMHYSKLISGLRCEFANLQENGTEGIGRLLGVLMVTCHYEAVSGDTKGAMFNHLRASRHLISSLVTHKGATQSWRAIDHSALGFSLELYAYLTLCNTIIPSGIAVAGQPPLDALVMSLEEMASFPTFGALFAGSHELFQILAEISQLASHRLAEETAGSVHPTESLKNSHDDLCSRLRSWKMPPPPPGESLGHWEHKSRAAETHRQGLHIYLLTALAGSTVSDPAVKGVILEHVKKLFSYVPQVVASQYYLANILWPVVIGGTCIVEPRHQQVLRREMGYNQFSLRNLKVLGDILQLLWDDPDPRAFGPYGLYLTMEKHGQTVGIV